MLGDSVAFAFGKSCFDDGSSFHSLSEEMSLGVGCFGHILSRITAGNIGYLPCGCFNSDVRIG